MASLQLIGGLLDAGGKKCSLYASVRDDQGVVTCTTAQDNPLTHGHAFTYGSVPLNVISDREATVEGFGYRTHDAIRLDVKDGYVTFSVNGTVVCEGVFKSILSIVPNAAAPVAPTV